MKIKMIICFILGGFGLGFAAASFSLGAHYERECLIKHRVNINGTDFLCVVNEIVREQPQQMRAPAKQGVGV